MPKYGVISGPYLPVFSPIAGKYGPEITPYMDTFHAVYVNGQITVVDISHFYITWVISQQFSRRDLKPMAFLVENFK